MKKLKIAMPGAGSGFVLSIAKELLVNPVFADAEFCLMDPCQERLDVARGAVQEIVQNSPNHIRVSATTNRTEAIEGADYVITSCDYFEKLYGRRADKTRKLYNGMLPCTLYQFFKPAEFRQDKPFEKKNFDKKNFDKKSGFDKNKNYNKYNKK